MKPLSPHQSFTLVASGVAREILSDIIIAEAYSSDGVRAGTQNVFNGKALWDTGATNCAITDKAAKELGLLPIDKVMVRHADGETPQNVYLVDVYLPNKVAFTGLRVTECKHTDNCPFGLLVGMDVICSGDFAVTNFAGKTVVTYRYPSVQKIDFVAETAKQNKRVGKQPFYRQFNRR